MFDSIDVTILYTNVPNDAALETTFKLLLKHHSSLNLQGSSISQVMAVLSECLNCNIFMWSRRYFKQLRGIAMGQRLANVLAIAFMSDIEAPVLARSPILFYRYIDDCIIMCLTQTEVDICFQLLTEQSPRIKSTRETPRDGCLPFLNVLMRLVSGTLETKWYSKPINKNILVQQLSAHLNSIKKLS